MTDTDHNLKCAEAQMLIRKPVAKVFEALIDPALTTNFWFTKSTGKLEVDKKITWEWVIEEWLAFNHIESAVFAVNCPGPSAAPAANILATISIVARTELCRPGLSTPFAKRQYF